MIMLSRSLIWRVNVCDAVFRPCGWLSDQSRKLLDQQIMEQEADHGDFPARGTSIFTFDPNNQYAKHISACAHVILFDIEGHFPSNQKRFSVHLLSGISFACYERR